MAGSSTSADSGNTHRKVASRHSVFLSHSGAQKDFVEQLCVDLESRHRSVFFDKRSDSLPKGEPFPQHIFQAIQECEVGVVVLSDEFFCSKWPMLELVEMSKTMKSNDSRLKIMPIFFSMSPAECRDETNQKRWSSIWCEWAHKDSRMKVEEWEAALKLLGPTNGFVREVGMGEVNFREEIVKEICTVVHPAPTWDGYHVQGGSRLCKVICDKLDTIQACYGVRVMGVHGVGGIGKTALCKSLCKNFFMEFQGKVCHVELKEGRNKLDLLREVLRRLSDTSEKDLQGFNEDKCLDLLIRSINKHRVFIAIDNVSDSSKCVEEANAFLRLNYVHGSVLIVTARSLGHLRMVRIEAGNCLEMPDLEKDEARSLVMYHANPGGHVGYAPMVEVDEGAVERCLKRCYFYKGQKDKYHYHPLALEVLGRQLGYNPKPWNVQLDELDAGDTFNQLRERNSEHPIFSMLRRSFDTLADEDQLLFMDAAIFILEDYWWAGTDMLKWLSLVHGVSVNVVKQRLMGLKRKSVIEEVGDGRRSIGMHDLWREFAVMETRLGDRERQRWVYDSIGSSSLIHEAGGVVGARFGGGWVNLQRMCIMRTERAWMDMEGIRRRSTDDRNESNISHRMRGMQLFKSCICVCASRAGEPSRSTAVAGPMNMVDEVDFRSCRNVTVLKLVRAKLKVLDLSALPNLRSLEYYVGNLFLYYSLPLERVEVRGLGGLSSLVILLLHGIPRHSSWIEQISGLTRLQILHLESGTGYSVCEHEHENKYPDLRRLCLLQHVCIRGFNSKAKSICGLSERMSNLRILDLSLCSFSRCDGVGDVIALEELYLFDCERLKELPNLQRFTKLRKLCIWGCGLLRALPGFGGLVALVELRAGGCSKITHLPDMSNLTHLEVLDLSGCPVNALLGLVSSISLREINVSFEVLEECGDLQMLTVLREVRVRGWVSQGLPCLSSLPKLEELHIRHSSGVDVLTGLTNLTSLLKLNVYSCDFTDVSCVSHSSTLRELSIEKCDKLVGLPDIHRLTRLESLLIDGCKSLRMWEGLRRSRLLESVVYTSAGRSIFPLLVGTLKYNGVPDSELPEVTSFPHLKDLSLYPPSRDSIRH